MAKPFEYTTPETRTCKQCGESKPLSEFNHENRKRSVGAPHLWHDKKCRDCRSKQLSAPRYNLPTPPEKTCVKCERTFPTMEGFPPYQKHPNGHIYYRSHCNECWTLYRAIYHGKYRAANRDKLNRMERASYEKHKENIKKSAKRYYEKLRNQVFEHYGNRCSCCGETESVFLTIDHVNDDGSQHRKQRGMGTILYRWVIANGFPDTVRILCYNCNAGRFRNGGICPHDIKQATNTGYVGVVLSFAT